MKTAFAVVVLLAIGILAAGCYAQSASSFQSVGGDFGQNWISSFMAQNSKPAENKSDSLWSWGGAPKGSMLLNGKLMPVPNTTVANANSNWLGDILTDPYTGKPVYDDRPVFPKPDYGFKLPPVFDSKDPWA